MESLMGHHDPCRTQGWPRRPAPHPTLGRELVFGHPAASLVFALAGFVLLVFALNVAGPLKNARGWITDPLDN